MRRIAFLLVALFLLASPATPAVAGPEQSLEVEGLRVTFLEGSRIRVVGKLRCKGIRQGENDLPGSVDVCVEYPGSDGAFARLPEYFAGRSPDAPIEEWLDATGAYFHHGTWYPVTRTEPRIYNSTALAYPPLLDRGLDGLRDEGKWIPFDATQRFAGRAGEGARYRIVVSWRFEYLTDFTVHRYFWVVYGPFPWGDAPRCDRPLVARSRTPVTFNGRDVETGKPVGDAPPQVQAEVGVAEDENAEEVPVPKRSGRRPNQGMAADLCTALDETLEGWSRVQRASSRANPRAAVLDVTVAKAVPTDSLAALAARVATQAAASLDWVQSVSLTLHGAHGTTKIGCTWDAIVAHAKGETTLAEFHATWTLEGDAIPPPPKDA